MLSADKSGKQFLPSAVNLRAKCASFSFFYGPDSNIGFRLNEEGRCEKENV